ncbi:MAG: T9SS type A sorting domain-containing protein [Cytophagales bacterium]
MKKNVLVFMFGSLGLWAQSTLSSEVVSTGKSLTTTTLSIDYNIGGVCNNFMNNESSSIKIGVLQPLKFSITDVEDLKISNSNFELYPNPVYSKLNIVNPNQQKFNLMSTDGKVLGAYSSENEIDMSKYTDGVYLINILNNNNQNIQSLKVIKK